MAETPEVLPRIIIVESDRTPNPLTLKYIKLLRIFLWTVGGWPGEIFGQNVPLYIRYLRRHIPVQTIIIFVGQCNFITKFTQGMNLFTKGHCYLTTILSVLTTVRTSLPNFETYGEITKKFLMSFHLIHFKHKGAYYEEMYNLIEKVSYYMTRFQILMTVSAIILFNAPPCYQNYKMGAFSGNINDNATLELSVYYAYPHFNPFENFIFCSIFNVYLTHNCGISVCGIDLLLSLMIFQIIGHVQILRNNLGSMPQPKEQVAVKFYNNGLEYVAVTEMYDDEENKMVHEKLIECVDHHRLIVTFTDEMSTFFGPMLAINYLFHLVSCCLLLLECSEGNTDAILRFGPLTIIVFGQLIQISITFEIVGTMSEKLNEAVYSLPWESMDTRSRRLVCILLHRVQTPIQVVVMGLASVGVTTMAGILKTTFTYFTFLRSIDE